MDGVTGLTELDSALASIVGALSGPNLGRVTDAASSVFLDAVSAGAPVKSGALKANIDRLESEHAHKATSTVEVANSQKGGDEFYAVMLEHGTSKMPAHPFVRPAFEQSKQAALSAAEAEVQNLIDGAR